jgi:uridine phosphorylase
LATGIGTDNIDIVVNELDAAVNFDLDSRTPLKELTSLNLIRIGTCGALQSDLPVNSTVVSEWAIGLDGVRHFYAIEEHRDEERIRTMLEAFLGDDLHMNPLYVARASQALLSRFQHLGKPGMTLTANGFFGPQGRSIRIPLAFPSFNEKISKFETHGARIENYEMESSALFALGGALGHACLSLCVVVANRKAKEFSKDYAPAMRALITGVLDTLAKG